MREAVAPAACEMCGQTIGSNEADDGTRARAAAFVAYLHQSLRDDPLVVACVLRKCYSPDVTVRELEAWIAVHPRPRRSRIAEALDDMATRFPGLRPVLGKTTARSRAQTQRRQEETTC